MKLRCCLKGRCCVRPGCLVWVREPEQEALQAPPHVSGPIAAVVLHWLLLDLVPLAVLCLQQVVRRPCLLLVRVQQLLLQEAG